MHDKEYADTPSKGTLKRWILKTDKSTAHIWELKKPHHAEQNEAKLQNLEASTCPN